MFSLFLTRMTCLGQEPNVLQDVAKISHRSRSLASAWSWLELRDCAPQTLNLDVRCGIISLLLLRLIIMRASPSHP